MLVSLDYLSADKGEKKAVVGPYLCHPEAEVSNRSDGVLEMAVSLLGDS